MTHAIRTLQPATIQIQYEEYAKYQTEHLNKCCQTRLEDIPSSETNLQAPCRSVDWRHSFHSEIANEQYLCASPSPNLETPASQGALISPPCLTLH